MKRKKHIIVGLFAVAIMLLMLTELPKMPLLVLAVGLIGLALVSTRRKKEFTVKRTKHAMISLFAITGLLIAGIICSCIVVVKAKPEEARIFMATRIEHCGNVDIAISLWGYVHDYKVPDVLTWRSVPWSALVPAFVLSELKTAFWIEVRRQE
ncbi:MAG: hypothetical protein FWG73_05210 [Planctomycetaceae bacterium]|nr:hypothetical protein [Planctomycetaceae bacterium]